MLYALLKEVLFQLCPDVLGSLLDQQQAASLWRHWTASKQLVILVETSNHFRLKAEMDAHSAELDRQELQQLQQVLEAQGRHQGGRHGSGNDFQRKVWVDAFRTVRRYPKCVPS